jgi:cell division protein FtsX
MKWIAVIAAFVSGAVVAFLMWLGWNGIDDLGLTSQSAMAFTLGGMLGVAVGLALGCVAWLLPSHRPDSTARDRAGEPSPTNQEPEGP